MKGTFSELGCLGVTCVSWAQAHVCVCEGVPHKKHTCAVSQCVWIASCVGKKACERSCVCVCVCVCSCERECKMTVHMAFVYVFFHMLENEHMCECLCVCVCVCVCVS